MVFLINTNEVFDIIYVYWEAKKVCSGHFDMIFHGKFGKDE